MTFLEWMTDEDLINAEREAYRKAKGCPIYTAEQVRMATQSGARSARAAEEWMRYYEERKARGLVPA